PHRAPSPRRLGRGQAQRRRGRAGLLHPVAPVPPPARLAPRARSGAYPTSACRPSIGLTVNTLTTTCACVVCRWSLVVGRVAPVCCGGQAYLEDAVADRLWVDDECTRAFVANILTAFPDAPLP